eukprot:1055394-Amphidinium_carterae.1
MRSWLTNGPPASFWLPCFYFPQGFMTASMQVHSRKTKIPIDTLMFWTEVTTTQDCSPALDSECGGRFHVKRLPHGSTH